MYVCIHTRSDKWLWANEDVSQGKGFSFSIQHVEKIKEEMSTRKANAIPCTIFMFACMYVPIQRSEPLECRSHMLEKQQHMCTWKRHVYEKKKLGCGKKKDFRYKEACRCET